MPEMLRSMPVTFSAAGPRDVAKRAAGLGLVLLPAHPPEPQLGAPVVVWRVERVDVRRSDRTAAEQGFQPKRRAAGIGCPAAEASCNRKRDRRMNQIMRHELQQIRVPRGDRMDFPSAPPVDPACDGHFIWRPSAATGGASAAAVAARPRVNSKGRYRTPGIAATDWECRGSGESRVLLLLERSRAYGPRKFGEMMLQRRSAQPSTVSRPLAPAGQCKKSREIIVS